MHEIDAGPDYYTIEEVADVLSVSTDTIRRRIRSGQLQAVKREASEIPGHGQRWYIPRRALGMQEVTDVVQVPHALTLDDFDAIITARLEAILNERDERVVEVVRTELSAVLEQSLDEQLRVTNRRIEGIDRAIRALPAPATPETITELHIQIKDIKAELAGVKESIGTVAQNAQAAADNVKALLPEKETKPPKRSLRDRLFRRNL
jgi:hypothetical protein